MNVLRRSGDGCLGAHSRPVGDGGYCFSGAAILVRGWGSAESGILACLVITYAANRHKCWLSVHGDVSVEGVETDRLQGLALIEANAFEP